MAHFGPFDIEERLASGAMGVVWRGRHRPSGLPVAIKVIGSRIDDSRRRLFEREVRSHARLTHPGIVYLFDYGALESNSETPLAAGSPCLAMELADGTLRDELPISDWPTLRHVLVSVLDALAHAHARDVIHRDLKPENILVFREANGIRFKLADFGIAHALQDGADSSLEDLESFVGTPHYMAPEQIHGRWRDYGPWTDLYAVACIAWALVCHRPPFTGSTPFAVAMAQASEDRPELEPQFAVPDALDAWIRRAMALPIRSRFLNAAEALAALPPLDAPVASAPTAGPTDELLAVAETQLLATLIDDGLPTLLADTVKMSAPALGADNAGEDEAAGRITRPTLRPPSAWRPPHEHETPAPLVGAGLGLFGMREVPVVDRTASRDQLWSALRNVTSNGGIRVVVLSGGPGTGKSRLARWLVTRADELGLGLRLEAEHRRGAGQPFEGLSRLMRKAFRGWQLDVTKLDAFASGRISTIPGAPTADEAKLLASWLAPTGEGSDFDDLNLSQRHAFIERMLRRVTRRRPAIVWLDDLQWGPDSLGTLVHLLQLPASEMPNVCVVATVRSDLLASAPGSVQAKMTTVIEHERVQEVEVEPLARKDQRELIRRSLGLRDEHVGLLAQRAEGNPLFATQIVSFLIDRGDIRYGPNGLDLGGELKHVPDTIRAVWEQRLAQVCDALPDVAVRESLEVAAALGRRVDLAEWRLACDELELSAPPQLVREVLQRGLAEEAEDGWAFTHILLVDSLLASADDNGRLASVHEACARTLTRWSEQNGTPMPGRIAEHWTAAGNFEAALPQLRTAADAAYNRGDFDATSAFLAERAKQFETLGVGLADPRRIRDDILAGFLCMSVASDVDRARELGESAVARASQTGAVELQARANDLLSFCAYRQGNPEEALQFARRCVEAAERPDGVAYRAEAYTSLAWALLDTGDHDGAETSFRRGLSVALETDDTVRELGIRSDLCWLAVEQGDFEEAFRVAKELLPRVRQLGSKAQEQGVLADIGTAGLFVGAFDEARDALQLSYELATEMRDQYAAAMSALERTAVELADQRYDAAEAELRRTDDSLPTENPELRRAAAVCRLALAAARGHRDEFDHAAQALETLLDAGGVDRKTARHIAQLAAEQAETNLPDRADVAAQLVERFE